MSKLSSGEGARSIFSESFESMLESILNSMTGREEFLLLTVSLVSQAGIGFTKILRPHVIAFGIVA
jgi:hypothetical protein